MKHKNIFKSFGSLRSLKMTGCLAALLVVLASCSGWNKTESVDLQWHYWWDENPEAWARYTASLREYKQSRHFLVYSVFDNSPENAGSERYFMRNLPDSLDIVSLKGGFTAYDAEDMKMIKEKGTKVLYRIDGASADLDKAKAIVKENSLDGWAFASMSKETTSSILASLSATKTEGQMIVFEGNPAAVEDQDMEKIDLFVLATEKYENVQEVRLAAIAATSRGIQKDKILLSADFDGVLYDEDKAEHPALGEMAARMIEFGPFGGLAIHNIGADYFHTEGNYLTVRSVIHSLNP